MEDASAFSTPPSNVGRESSLCLRDAVVHMFGTVRAATAQTCGTIPETWLKRSAATGLTVSTGGSLSDPLGLTVAPNGRILAVNGNDGFIAEITPRGRQLAKVLPDNTGGPPQGDVTLFGVTFDPLRGVLFVDDRSNTLNSLK